MDSSWVAYAVCFSPRKNAMVGVRTMNENGRWSGCFQELRTELRVLEGMPMETPVLWGFGEYKGKIDIWYDV